MSKASEHQRERRHRYRGLVVAAVAAMAAMAACGDGGTSHDARLPVTATIDLGPGTEPAALAAFGDGALLVGERRTGGVRLVTAAGALAPEPVAQVAVRAGDGDQRGLLGLAVDGERVYAAWTRAADGRIVVAELTGGTERLVWEGPRSSDLANGGHLAFLPDGRLVVGIGDLRQPDRVDDPDAPNGKLLALDPAGPATQRPRPLSRGWNNPFAFTVTPDGALWVADNAPGDEPERIGRGDGRGEPTVLPGHRAPAALVALGSGRLGVCGYLDGELTLVELEGDEPRLRDPVASGCRTGAAVLADGRVAVSDGRRVRLLAER